METKDKSKGMYLFTVFYILNVYAVPFLWYAYAWATFEKESVTPVLWLVMLSPLLLAGGTCIYMKKKWDSINRLVLLRCSVLVKYLLIPMYIAGGLAIVLFILLIFTPIIIMASIGPIVVGYLSLFGWLYMLGGSVFAHAYLRKAEKEGIHPKWLCFVAKVCQFFFTIDVLAMAVLTLKERKNILFTVLTVLALMIGAVVAFAKVISWFTLM